MPRIISIFIAIILTAHILPHATDLISGASHSNLWQIVGMRCAHAEEKLIGIGVNLLEGAIVYETFEGSPARLAGIQEKDTIIAIDDQAITGKPLSDVVPLIRGKEGSTVVIKVLRPGKTNLLVFSIVRRTIAPPPTDPILLVEGFRKAAELGDVNSQYNLAVAYSMGHGVNQDYSESARWYRKAAEQGDAGAQYTLGTGYFNGQGVKQDYVEAVKWFRKAAEQGEPNAQSMLGYAYDSGKGVKQDDFEAIKWFRRAAEQGNANAQSNLGLAYFNGRGVKQDYQEGVKWYRKAAEQGDVEAQSKLGYAYNFAIGVIEDRAEAVKWYRKAAEQGNASSQNSLGDAYNFGWGVTQDRVEAVKWYRKGAELGDAASIYSIGMVYDHGYGVRQDYAEAMNWYRKAAAKGNGAAQDSVGDLYFLGQGVKQDYIEAAKWYQRAAEKGWATSQYNLGKMYFSGQGVKQDYSEAAKWYRKAAEQGDAAALYALGNIYSNGQGVKKDAAEADTWFRKAAEKGNKEAQNKLGFSVSKDQSVKKTEEIQTADWYRQATLPTLRIETGQHTAGISSLDVDSSGRWLVSASFDKTVREWDLDHLKTRKTNKSINETIAPVRVIRPPIGEGPNGILQAVAISPNSELIAFAGMMKSGRDIINIYLFSRKKGQFIGNPTALPQGVSHLTFSPDGQWLAASLFQKNGIRIFAIDAKSSDDNSPQPLRMIAEDKEYGDNSMGAHFSSDSKKLVTSSFDGNVRIYRTDDMGKPNKSGKIAMIKPILKRKVDEGQSPEGTKPGSVKFSPDNSKVAVGYYGFPYAAVLSSDDLSLLYIPNTKGSSSPYIAWSTDGRALFGGITQDDENKSAKAVIRKWPEAGKGAIEDRKMPNLGKEAFEDFVSGSYNVISG
ncbi:MAG: PDZ domain-containing protein, partial [Deltaproteobacteria bacterium]